MVTEALLSAVFILGAPLWLAIGEVLHRMNDRAKAEPATERRPARKVAPASHAARA
ncbi:MAG: hypothetical protein HYU25_05600 [Candidatus Rokubacteria bacterium]|nr:hypothetical protein [Candidatus Rokubacteria bacterium]